MAAAVSIARQARSIFAPRRPLLRLGLLLGRGRPPSRRRAPARRALVVGSDIGRGSRALQGPSAQGRARRRWRSTTATSPSIEAHVLPPDGIGRRARRPTQDVPRTRAAADRRTGSDGAVVVTAGGGAAAEAPHAGAPSRGVISRVRHRLLSRRRTSASTRGGRPAPRGAEVVARSNLETASWCTSRRRTSSSSRRAHAWPAARADMVRRQPLQLPAHYATRTARARRGARHASTTCSRSSTTRRRAGATTQLPRRSIGRCCPKRGWST